eukprot:3087708-Pleurochrysis_carterae.AAC.1
MAAHRHCGHSLQPAARSVEGRVGAFSLVVCHFARGLDSVDEGKVHPDAGDVNHFLSTISGGDCRADQQVRYLEALRVVIARVLDALDLLLVLEDLLWQMSGPARTPIAWPPRVDLVVVEVACPLRAPLPIGELVRRPA